MLNKRFPLLFLLTLMISEPVLAHSPIEGLGNFYNGLLHPVMVPAHLLLLIVLGLLVGQKGMYQNRVAIMVVLISTGVGLIGAWYSVGGEIEIVLLSAAAMIGLLIALNNPLGNYFVSIMTAFVGLFIGIDSAQDLLSGTVKLLYLIGCGVGTTLTFLCSMVFADYFNKQSWQQIIVRVLGSWIAASALLVLALSFASS